MKPLVVSLILAALGAGPAAASPSPYQPERPQSMARKSVIDLEQTGAQREADYFRAPVPRYGATRIFPCRFELRAERAGAIVQACD